MLFLEANNRSRIRHMARYYGHIYLKKLG